MVNFSGMVTASFSGGTGVGAVSVPGLKAGDRVLQKVAPATGVNYDGYFEPIITVDDEIQQIIGADISSITIGIVAYRGP